MTSPGYILPKVRVTLYTFVRTGNINQANTHVVPHNAKLPIERNKSSCLQSMRTPLMELAIYKFVPCI
jgi:hypothetical protein